MSAACVEHAIDAPWAPPSARCVGCGASVGLMVVGGSLMCEPCLEFSALIERENVAEDAAEFYRAGYNAGKRRGVLFAWTGAFTAPFAFIAGWFVGAIWGR